MHREFLKATLIVITLHLGTCQCNKEIEQVNRKLFLNGKGMISEENAKRRNDNSDSDKKSSKMTSIKSKENQEDGAMHFNFRKTKDFGKVPGNERWKTREKPMTDISKLNEDLEAYFQFANLQLQLQQEMLKILKKWGKRPPTTIGILRKLRNDKNHTLFNLWKNNILRKNSDKKISFAKDMENNKTWKKTWQMRKIANTEDLFNKNPGVPLQSYEIEFFFKKQKELPVVKKEAIEGIAKTIKANAVPTYNQWSQWSACSKTCGKGTVRERFMFCRELKSKDEVKCPGWNRQTVPCEVQAPCPVDGGFTEWTPWSECSSTCGLHSIKMRMRVCTNPPPMNGGRDCDGWRFNLQFCNTTKCPQNESHVRTQNGSPKTVISVDEMDQGNEIQDDRLTYRAHTIPLDDIGYQLGHTDYGTENVASVSDEDGIDSTVTPFTDLTQETHDSIPFEDEGVALRFGFTKWSSWSPCTATCGRGFHLRTRGCVDLDAGTSKNLLSTDLVKRSSLPAHNCLGHKIQKRFCNIRKCPVMKEKHKFSVWSTWSTCSQTCGEDSAQIRIRVCDGSKPCMGKTTEKRQCLVKHCPTVVPLEKMQINNSSHHVPDSLPSGMWSDWSPCPVTCGNGISRRIKTCPVGDAGCVAQSETKLCGFAKCPVNGGYSEWSIWSTCTPTCGLVARKSRSRICDKPPPMYGGKNCTGPAIQVVACSTVKCPVDGDFSEWSSWTPCSQTCATTALSRRERNCSNPVPMFGGRDCMGKMVELRQCGTQPCPVNGRFTEWTSWSECSKTCDTLAMKKRERYCTNPSPRYGGKNCEGEGQEKKPCSLATNCPVNGGYSPWTTWSACPSKCGKSAADRSRTRQCNNPKPAFEGSPCVGPPVEKELCPVKLCPVNGGFTEWTSWTPCDHECNSTTLTGRERYCTNPTPANGGNNCHGPRVQVKVCHWDQCKVDGGLSKWSKWSRCPRCGSGNRKRVRYCNDPSPMNGGKNCVGPTLQVERCPKRYCNKGNGLSSWSRFSLCSRSCGGGVQKRRRRCIKPSLSCHGKKIQIRRCNMHRCRHNENYLVTADPASVCGFNPCTVSKCLSHPFALCVSNTKCQPVFFDKQGNILNDCRGTNAYLTVAADKVCKYNPCKYSTCLSTSSERCVTSSQCQPVFFDGDGNKLNCRGLLKVPPRLICKFDPCDDQFCNGGKCIVDYKCRAVFVTHNYKVLNDCPDGDDEDDDNDEEDQKESKNNDDSDDDDDDENVDDSNDDDKDKDNDKDDDDEDDSGSGDDSDDVERSVKKKEKVEDDIESNENALGQKTKILVVNDSPADNSLQREIYPFEETELSSIGYKRNKILISSNANNKKVFEMRDQK